MPKPFVRLAINLFLFLFASSLPAQSAPAPHIAAGSGYSLFVDPDGALWVWGRTRLEKDASEQIPHAVMTEAKAVFSLPNSNTSLVVKQNLSLWGWGYSETGQLQILQLYSDNQGLILKPCKLMDHIISAASYHTTFALDTAGRYGCGAA